MVTRDEARAAKSMLRERLQRVDGVQGVGLTRRGESHEWVLQVDVADVRARKDVPPDVEGVPVTVCVVGAVQPL